MKKHMLPFLMLLCMFFPCKFSAVSAVPIDMVYVSSGYSMMGAEYGDLTASMNAKPNHLVYLDAFYIDTHEVTNEDYAVCVAAGACREPESVDSKTREGYYASQIFAKFPVVNVTWQDAVDYCEFVEKRLPTEAEWERAARGIADDRRYPWGEGSPNMNRMNTSLIPGDTEMVNIYTGGISPYGAADMLGNAAEWTADWYDAEWYLNGERDNPTGPMAGTEKVIRGGSFETRINELHAAARDGMDPESYSYAVGFRCALGIRESVGYEDTTGAEEGNETEFAYVQAGNENGIFLLSEPGTGYDSPMLGVIPNGAVVEILAGPVNINYSKWYQIRTQTDLYGWTLSSALVLVDETPLLIGGDTGRMY